MLASAPLVAGILAFLATLLVWRAVVGRPDPRAPRCRRCGRDVRPFAWAAPPTCACGARLDASRAVRLRRRRKRDVLAAAAGLALGVGFVLAAIRVWSTGVGWEQFLPSRLYAELVARGWDHPWHLSAGLRAGAGASREEVATLRDAFLRRVEAEEPINEAWSELFRLTHRAVPTGDDGARLMAVVLRDLDLVDASTTDAAAVGLRLADMNTGEPRAVQVRIDDVRVAGQSVPFAVPTENRTQTMTDSTFARPRVWFPVTGTDRRGTLRIVLTGRSSVDVAEVHVSGQLAYASDLLSSVEFDETIATERDPAAWGVDVAVGPLAIDGTPGPPRAPAAPVAIAMPRWQGWWPLPHGRPTMPAIAAAPIVAFAIVGALGAVVVAVAWRLLGAAAWGSWRWSPPRCPRCKAFVRGAGDALPERCQECGTSIAGIDACLYAQRKRSGAAIAVGVLAVPLAIGAGLFAYPAATHLTEILLAWRGHPEAEAAWLAEATLAAETFAMGPGPGNRLWDGQLDSEKGANAIYRPPLAAAATEVILAWWNSSAGVLPASAEDADGSRRRREIGAFLRNAVWAGAIEPEPVAAILEWADPSPFAMPRLGRVGQPLRLGGRWTMSTGDYVISALAEPRRWQWPWKAELPVPTEPGVIEVEAVWSRPSVKVVPGQFDPSRGGSGMVSRDAPPPAGDPRLERRVRGRVTVVPADAPFAYPGTEFDAAIQASPVELLVRESGRRSALSLRTSPLRELPVGSWEVRLDDDLAKPPLASIRVKPTGWGPLGMAELPSPLPERLLLRFVPDSTEAASKPSTWPPVPYHPQRFELRRSGDEVYLGTPVVVYRNAR